MSNFCGGRDALAYHNRRVEEYSNYERCRIFKSFTLCLNKKLISKISPQYISHAFKIIKTTKHLRSDADSQGVFEDTHIRFLVDASVSDLRGAVSGHSMNIAEIDSTVAEQHLRIAEQDENCRTRRDNCRTGREN